MKETTSIYKNRSEKFANLNRRQKQTSNFYSILRLLIFCSGAGFLIYFLKYNNYLLAFVIFIITVLCFILVAKKHGELMIRRKICNNIIDINKKSLERTKGEWKSFKDTGKEYIDSNHDFSYDLDVFGNNSLFQYINTARTYFGRNALKNSLSNFPNSKELISKRQVAIKELAKNLWWRQKLEAYALCSENLKKPEKLIQWSKDKVVFYENNSLKIIINILPIFTVSAGVMHFMFGIIPYTIPAILFVIQILITGFRYGERAKYLSSIYEYKKDIETYFTMIKHVDKKKFQSEYLMELKGKLVDLNGQNSYTSMNEFSKIVRSISDRRNMFYIIKDLLFLWDYRVCFSFNKWKKESGENLGSWLEILGEFEALSSLAILNFDNPKWVTPEFTEKKRIIAKNSAHPLITGKRISNPINIDEKSPISLITGSNMAGKSTYLRTVGINLALAYTGAAVCASTFQCPILHIYTCMRVNDDIDKRISSFYGEIIRIKKITEAIEQKEEVFFLLDEIFKGTNSIDRHTGAKILINKLRSYGGIGLVSTHDLELSSLEDESMGKIKNYHFEEYYKNNEIFFDYKLKTGVSKTRNAMYLMKMAGIEI
ncbi:MutS family DNA mismatch repair protein [Clostridium sediminicola]|uniref:MutS-related protein n=1 Tax=Clostridium sediminicola TaxID=3114879 RepID=UPI0031F24B0C